MKRQPNRLPQDAKHGFGGTLLERSKPLSFRLNGRTYEAFAGDTVLTALLAAGIDGAGFHFGQPIALDERFSPPAVPTDARDAARAMPIDRIPVVQGLDLRTLGPRQSPFRTAGLAARIASAFRGTPSSLGHRLDDPHAFEGTWLRQPHARTIEADTVVVGGGVAGMSAALAAAEIGGRVLLVERRGVLGGDAAFFGAVGDEEPPETIIRRLTERIAATPSITVLLRTDALELTGSRIRAHEVALRDDKPGGRLLALDGRRIVIATGVSERLPLFSGNRMPGVVGAVSAFRRVQHYGVWRGTRAVFATPHSYAYRLALLAADAGIAVQRVADSRSAPQSRFIDFCKASGITLASSLVPRAAEAAGKPPQALSVAFAVAIEDAGQDTTPLTTELFIAAGSWQPRLGLWLMAGGRCAYHAGPRWIGAEGTLETVAIAGSAAGYRSSSACIHSGERAARTLVGGDPGPAVEDVEAGAIYESRDAPTAIAPWRAGRMGAYLDRGATFTPRPAQAGREAAVIPPAQMHGLSLGDVAAAVELGTIPLNDAGIVAQERCIGGGEILDSGWRPVPAAPSSELPPYLRGRFGSKPQQLVVAAPDGRYFEPGCLLYHSSELADPFAAIGVIVGPAPDGKAGGIALVDRAAANALAIFVRDTSGAVPVTVVAALKPSPKLRAAAEAP